MRYVGSRRERRRPSHLTTIGLVTTVTGLIGCQRAPREAEEWKLCPAINSFC